MYSRLGPSFISLILFIVVRAVAAAQINRTIDDTIGDVLTGTKPIYAPSTSGVWEDNTCTGCALQPDRTKAFQGTWTAATYNPGLGSMSVTLSFKGEPTTIVASKFKSQTHVLRDCRLCLLYPRKWCSRRNHNSYRV